MAIIRFKDSDRKPKYNHASRKRRAEERVDGYFRAFFNCDGPPQMTEEEIRTYVAKPVGKWMPTEEDEDADWSG